MKQQQTPILYIMTELKTSLHIVDIPSFIQYLQIIEGLSLFTLMIGKLQIKFYLAIMFFCKVKVPTNSLAKKKKKLI